LKHIDPTGTILLPGLLLLLGSPFLFGYAKPVPVNFRHWDFHEHRNHSRGQETTILTALVPLIHLGMVFVGTPYGQNPQILVTDGIGGSPYGPGTLAGTDGSRQPVEAELTTARNLGSRLARVAGRLKDLRVSRASTS
jgi:Zn-dependent protease